VIIHRPGRVAYEPALELQRAARARVLAGGEDELILLEHDPVVTLGRRGGLVDRAALARLGVPVVETERGGLATWHGPGQLVGYPIVSLERARVGIRAFVQRLGELMIATCERFGLRGVEWDGERPGVYREGRKVGSIGLHIHRGVSMHGFALNVDVALDGFQAIEPCGLVGLVVTSLARELGRPIDLAAVTDHVAAEAEAALAGPPQG